MTKFSFVITSLFLLLGSNPLVMDVFAQNISNESMSVKQEVRGNDVYVECVISNFTFSKRDEKAKGSGFIQLYLNGQKIDDIYTAAFIIKGLPLGNHLIKLELVQNDGTPYGINHEFEVKVS